MDDTFFAFGLHVIVILGASLAIRFLFDLSHRARTNATLSGGIGLAISTLHEVVYLGATALPSLASVATRVAEMCVAFVLLMVL